MRASFDILRKTIKQWQSEDIVRMSGVLSYYAALSLLPLFFVGIAGASFVFGAQNVENRLVHVLHDLLGAESTQLLQEAIGHITNNSNTNLLTVVVSAALLLYSATRFFQHLQSALKTIWEVKPAEAEGGKNAIRNTVIAGVSVTGVGLGLLLLLVVNTALFFALQSLEDLMPEIDALTLWQLGGVLLLLLGATAAFAALYKWLPSAVIQWEDALIGAGLTSLLFTAGQFLVALYLRHSPIDTLYGAAGVLLILLIWVNVVSHILVFCAVFIKVYAHQRGHQIIATEQYNAQRRPRKRYLVERK